MNDIKAFVDAFRDYYEHSGYCKEEEQILPPNDVLEEISRILLHTSCMSEEGRYSSFRVCFLSANSDLLDVYIFSHIHLFETPIEFKPSQLHKLAPALNADMSYLMLDITKKPYTAVGIIAAYTTWVQIMTMEIAAGIRMPRIPNILVKGPEELEACFGETSLVSYHAGECCYFRTDTFTSTFVSRQLENGSRISEGNRLRFLYRLLWCAHKYGHGGHIFIVPSADSCSKLTSYKYKMYGEFPSANGSSKKREKDIYTYANLIAKLTMVDGGVVLTKNLELIGFGVETYVDLTDKKRIDMCFLGHDNKENKSRHFNDNGMRHRACYQFCNSVEGSVAIILSQDGGIEACTKHEGKVVVYYNVGFPLL